MKSISARGPLQQLQATVSKQTEQLQELQAQVNAPMYTWTDANTHNSPWVCFCPRRLQVTRLQLHAKHQDAELQQAQQQACSSTQQLQVTSEQLAAHQQQLAAALSQQEALEQQLQRLQQERDQEVEQLQQQLGAAQEAERQLSDQLSRAGQVHSSMSAKLSALKGKLGLTEEEARSYVQVGPSPGAHARAGVGGGGGVWRRGHGAQVNPKGHTLSQWPSENVAKT